MRSSSHFGVSQLSAFDHPQYLALSGLPAEQAIELLMRKGRILSPPISRIEAVGIVSFVNLEHFKAESLISFDAQNADTGRLMLVLAGDASIRMRDSGTTSHDSDYSPLGQVKAKWFNATEGATLGLVHTFSGLFSRFMAQATTDLFVASLSRTAFHRMKQQQPIWALRFLEITALELALVTLDHEKSIVAMSNVARSMQDHIGDESGETAPAPLFEMNRLR